MLRLDISYRFDLTALAAALSRMRGVFAVTVTCGIALGIRCYGRAIHGEIDATMAVKGMQRDLRDPSIQGR